MIVVRLGYVVGGDEPTAYPTERADDPQDFAAKLATGAWLGRLVTAWALEAGGQGRRTFALERVEGRLVVHVVRMPQTGAQLRALGDQDSYRAIAAEGLRRFDPRTTVLWTVGGFVRYDPATGTTPGHYALGGGTLAVFSANSLSSWPSSLPDVGRALADTTPVRGTGWRDDSLGRATHWANASTGMGAWLHELGHCLGLPHPAPRERYALMSRGFDFFSRWFTAVDAPDATSPFPRPFAPSERPTWGSQAATLARHPLLGDLDPDEAPPLWPPMIVA